MEAGQVAPLLVSLADQRVGHGTFNVTHVRSGPAETTQAINWSDLPGDMVEAILGNLSWVDLARITSTCKAFRAAFRKELAHEQERRCKLAVACFGRGRIDRIADLIECHLEGIPLDLLLVPDLCWLLEDGTLNAAPMDMAHGNGYTAQVRVIGKVLNIYVFMLGHLGSCTYISVCQQSRVVTFKVRTWGDDDIEGVALLQALLNEALEPVLSGVGPHLDIRVMGDVSEGHPTQAGLRKQVAPLLPFSTVHTSGYRQANEAQLIGERIEVFYKFE
jgi:hypothetical protein